MQIIKRIINIPAGIFVGVIDFVNNCARDAENRKRFPVSSIDNGSSFTADVKIGEGTHVSAGCIVNHSEIGMYSYICRNTLIQNAVIGNYCSIAHDVNIGLGRHPTELVSTSPLFYKKNNPLKTSVVREDLDFDEYKWIVVGNDVWIGVRAIILDGVSIGDGAIIAAGAVVTKDVPPFAIVAGVPGVVIKYRHEVSVIDRIAKSQWWSFEPVKAFQIMRTLNI